GQAVVADPDAVGIAGRNVGAAIQHEGSALGQLDRPVGEGLDTDLRALQVGQDADFAARRGRGGAHRVGACAMVVRLAMREVETDHVDAFGNQLFEHAGGIAGGSERGDDLGAANRWLGSHAVTGSDVSGWGTGVQSCVSGAGARARLSTSARRRPASRRRVSASGSQVATYAAPIW